MSNPVGSFSKPDVKSFADKFSEGFSDTKKVPGFKVTYKKPNVAESNNNFNKITNKQKEMLISIVGDMTPKLNTSNTEVQQAIYDIVNNPNENDENKKNIIHSYFKQHLEKKKVNLFIIDYNSKKILYQIAQIEVKDEEKEEEEKMQINDYDAPYLKLNQPGYKYECNYIPPAGYVGMLDNTFNDNNNSILGIIQVSQYLREFKEEVKKKEYKELNS